MGILDVRKKKIFMRAYTEDINLRGMGIGLLLVKMILVGYGGQIWVEDRIKKDYMKGSNFVLLLKDIS